MLYIVRCYDGTDTTLSVKNCIEDDLLDVPEWKRTGSLPRDYLSLTLSVSETAEWVCTKTVYNNNTVRRGCHKTYTGNKKRQKRALDDYFQPIFRRREVFHVFLE